jgi:Cu/Ag efflux protein CusF
MVLPIVDLKCIKNSNLNKLKNINGLIEQKHLLIGVMIQEQEDQIVTCANGECNHNKLANSQVKLEILYETKKINVIHQESKFDICFNGSLMTFHIQDINFLEQLKKEIEDNIKQLEDLEEHA